MSDIIERVDIEDIKAIIPHRYPFLLIDRVVNIKPHESATGIKMVSVNEPHFTGHFPNQPVMPGVLIVEAMAQTAAVMVGKSKGLEGANMSVYFMAIDKVKFRSMVVPGDQLEMDIEVRRGGGKIWKFSGIARVGDNKVAEAEFTAMMVPPETSEQ